MEGLLTGESTYRGLHAEGSAYRGICIQGGLPTEESAYRGLHPGGLPTGGSAYWGGSASRGSAYRGVYLWGRVHPKGSVSGGLGTPLPPELERRAEYILLEFFLVKL